MSSPKATPRSPRDPRPRPPAVRTAESGRPATKAPATPKARSGARSRAATKPLPSEAVLFYLYDVGRSVNLRDVAALIPAHDDFDIVKRRDTPASLTLPRAMTLSLSDGVEGVGFDSFQAQAKIYAEGALVISLRVGLRVPFEELGGIRQRIVPAGDRQLSLDSWAEDAFRRTFAAIRPAVEDPRAEAACERETYIAYCLHECPGDPRAFVEANREAAAALLIGEDNGRDLHESQIAETLERGHSYHRDDLAIFDLDRCLIIDPRKDYEDLLLIVEHANWQLLELRVLDKLLDRWLDEAEDLFQHMESGKKSGLRRRSGIRGWPARSKRARLQSLRFDALFILENVENSSKIIGDYYLGQVYAQLCEVFNTDGWKWSVERRLDILENVYDMAKTDYNENMLITLEIWFIIVCVVIPVIQIYIMLKPTH